MTEPQEVPNAVFTGEPERVERGWSVHADWDWQRFLVGCQDGSHSPIIPVSV